MAPNVTTPDFMDRIAKIIEEVRNTAYADGQSKGYSEGYLEGYSLGHSDGMSDRDA